MCSSALLCSMYCVFVVVVLELVRSFVTVVGLLLFSTGNLINPHHTGQLVSLNQCSILPLLPGSFVEFGITFSRVMGCQVLL